MGKRLTFEDRLSVIKWAQQFHCPVREQSSPITAKGIANLYEVELRKYWNLCSTSRNINIDSKLSTTANQLLFSVRTQIESKIAETIHCRLKKNPEECQNIATGTVFGRSLKQGVSFRLPLYTCQPTQSCSGACYAHDGLDKSISSVVRGVFNGVLAELYEKRCPDNYAQILNLLRPHCIKVVSEARRELDRLPIGWKRAPFIRLAHVGEAVAYPNFITELARMIKELSQGEVACVIYTRHKNVIKLDPSLFVVNFTVDGTSENRRSWAPSWARIVYSAFDGELSSDADINFLEHHQNNRHLSPKGQGNICPATAIDVPGQTCDSCQCSLCFQPKD